ncbi:hypothetical protein D918_08013 [Trichuris suis]|nr:hypothetical protein D918_08013 [Trichuris suis]
MQPRHRYHVSLKEETAFCKIQFKLFPEGTHSSLCKQSRQHEFAPQAQKKSNSAEEGH